METTVGEHVLVERVAGESVQGTVRSVTPDAVILRLGDGRLVELSLASIASVRSAASPEEKASEISENPQASSSASVQAYAGGTLDEHVVAEHVSAALQQSSERDADPQGQTVRTSIRNERFYDTTHPDYKRGKRLRNWGFLPIVLGSVSVATGAGLLFANQINCGDAYYEEIGRVCRPAAPAWVAVGVGAAVIGTGIVLTSKGTGLLARTVKRELQIEVTAAPLVLHRGGGAQMGLTF